MARNDTAVQVRVHVFENITEVKRARSRNDASASESFG